MSSAMDTSSSESFSKEQITEVSSLIHNEIQCVTVQRVALTTGLSRTRASQLLGQVPTAEQSYEATLCNVQEDTVTLNEEPVKRTGKFCLRRCLLCRPRTRLYRSRPCCLSLGAPTTRYDDAPLLTPRTPYVSTHLSVFSLHKQEWKPDTAIDEATSTLVALALVPADATAETMHIAHERDMVLYRDMIQYNAGPLLDEHAHIDAIVPCAATLTGYRTSLQSGLDFVSDAPQETVSRVSSSSSSRLPKKVTTAAAFFGAKKEDKKPSKAVSSKTAKAQKPVKKAVPAAFAKKTATKAKSNPEEKENASKNDVGNADDFVGDFDDEEEDDDVCMQEPAMVRGEDPTMRRTIAIDDSDDDEDEAANPAKAKSSKKKAPLSGAMDAFTSQKPKPQESAGDSKKKRRRKRLVEKTTTDPNGYLHTETQEVWEDVPSDEEEAPSLLSKKAPSRLAATKKKGAGKTGMKQGNLMGFFKKK